MSDKFTAPQTALLAKLPAEFIRVEDFRKSNSPATIITDLSGREVYRFTTGDARAWKSLRVAGAVVDIETRNEGDLLRQVFMKA
jgi:hypothetical protein